VTNKLEKLRVQLAARAAGYDIAGAWPEESVQALTEAGAWRWTIPRTFGGEPLETIEHLEAYEAIAAGCMSTLLILTNRDSACELIAGSENEALQAELLPKLAKNEIMTTVGIAQLTTSHQTGPPTLTATAVGDGFRLDGFISWVTSAVKCQYIVAGAVLADQRQVLAAVSTGLPGLTIEPPLKLLSMEGTLTSVVRCQEVRIPKGYVLRGPADRVLSTRSGIKPALVACSGLGLARSMLDLIQANAPEREGRLAELADELATRLQAVRQRVYAFAASPDALTAEREKSEVRAQVNDLLMRLAVAVLTYAKGTGLLRDRDAQRLVREALFFLVWAAPEDVRVLTLARFLG
jgi:alkylation response protein AidB-like acyl-CoA dehydrogenase